MEEDVEPHGSVPKRAVDDNRLSVMDIATSLSESGELVLPGGGGDHALMY